MKQKFFGLLEDLFIGARVKGDSGISNLLDLKSQYFNKFKEELEEKMDNLGEAVYDRLYTFFKSYFNESGSLFFANTPKWQKRYARISNKDVELFYKTRDLYYIKSQKVYENLEIEVDDVKFYFDATMLGSRFGNEKKEIEFLFSDYSEKDNKFTFLVRYKTNQKYDELKIITGENDVKKARIEILNNFDKYKNIKITENFVFKNIKKFKSKGKISDKFEMIIKSESNNTLLKELEIILTLKNYNDIEKLVDIDEEILNKAFKTYNKQIQVDYFIHKDARNFLKEQFDLWIYDYLANDIETIFNQNRLDEIREIKKIAYELIDKIADFEDELKSIWLKPRFALNSNYVITKDRLEKYGVLDKFLSHEGIKNQIEEWKELKLVDEDFDISKINDEKYKFLPFDTKYFKDIEINLLEKIDNLDNELDGRLIKSENFQALNTLLPKFKNQIDLIYIDPPYNAPSSEIIYINNFKHSTWLTLMENRISIAKEFLKKDGFNLVAIDDFEIRYLIKLIDDIFDINNYVTTFTIEANPQGRVSDKISKTNEFTIFHIRDKQKVNKIFMKKLRNSTPSPLKRTGTNSRREERPNRFFPILLKDNRIYMIKKEEYKLIYNKKNNKFDDEFLEKLKQKYEEKGYSFVLPLSNTGEKLVWQRTFDRIKEEKDSYIIKNGNIYTPVFDVEIPKTLLKDNKYANPEYGSEYLKNLLNGKLFETPKSFYTIMQFLSMKEKNIFVLDFFAGSGTTADAVIRLNKDDKGSRKFLLIEMGEHFYNVILPRIKKLCVSLNYKQGMPQDRDGNSLFFKYYELEQFEDILKKAKYKDNLDISPKMSYATDIDFENEKLFYAFEKLYPNIDIAETISNLIGEKIIKITKNKIVLENREIDLNDLTFENYPELKSLIYWS